MRYYHQTRALLGSCALHQKDIVSLPAASDQSGYALVNDMSEAKRARTYYHLTLNGRKIIFLYSYSKHVCLICNATVLLTKRIWNAITRELGEGFIECFPLNVEQKRLFS